MRYAYNLLAVIWLQSLLITGNEDLPKSINNDQNGETTISLLSAGVYAKLFAERRTEHQLMIRKMLASDNYEKNFKLLQLAYRKIFEVIMEKNSTLTSYGFVPAQEPFPQNSDLQDAVTVTLENCCIAAESLLHFPEISYRIFDKNNFSQWKLMLNWCNEFVSSFSYLIDESTVKLMDLLLQEINEEQRMPNYVNPYNKALNNQATKKREKQHKKLKKGPHLSGGKTEL
ncbi:coiled-coil domain-containing protein 134-like [Anastrepha obliqua]|uniref:coiled-coil domain-containing protein 134-like n=1 Tax=Anastrepha obliqua TaxID=95512 RepID=UPI002409F7A6|nr:coiled-coil domain-containing protein 134-like [Anastrepha obliqua]